MSLRVRFVLIIGVLSLLSAVSLAFFSYRFSVNNALVEAVNRGDPNEFMQIGREQMAGNTLRRDAVRLVVNGRTTIEEAMRISTQLDE